MDELDALFITEQQRQKTERDIAVPDIARDVAGMLGIKVFTAQQKLIAAIRSGNVPGKCIQKRYYVDRDDVNRAVNWLIATNRRRVATIWRESKTDVVECIICGQEIPVPDDAAQYGERYICGACNEVGWTFYPSGVVKPPLYG